MKAGTLLANNANGSATGTGAVTVQSGGTLGGNGFTGGRGLGFSGEPSVNVMQLNLAIAQRTGARR